MESKTSGTIYIMSEAELVETAIGVLEEVSLIFTSVCEGRNGRLLTEPEKLEVIAWGASSQHWSNYMDPSSLLNKMWTHNLSPVNKLWL